MVLLQFAIWEFWKSQCFHFNVEF